jgi:uncharacterized protein YdaU (DUF1376 family)
MDACYDRERFPTEADAIDWCWASTPEEIAAVKFVLSKFFELVDGKYTQTRIQEEINDFHGKSETNRQIALEREEKRRNARNVLKEARNVNDPSPEQHEPPPNHKPLTTNQKPISKSNTSPDGFAEFYTAYPKKVGRPAAEKAYKTEKAERCLEFILKDIDSRLSSGDWSLDKRKFIPNPATYLNQRRWEDEAGEEPANTAFAGMI